MMETILYTVQRAGAETTEADGGGRRGADPEAGRAGGVLQAARPSGGAEDTAPSQAEQGEVLTKFAD